MFLDILYADALSARTP